jgi:tetratricopeptide (TPR) repeat protein
VQQAIAEKNYVTLDVLLLKDDENYDGFDYAHGWSFVYFLQNSPKYAKPLGKLFKEIYGLDLKEAKAEILDAGEDDKSGLRKRYAAADIRDVLVKRLGVKDLATLEKEWLDYVAAVKIEGARARFLRGYSTTFSGGDMKKARLDLDAALAGGYGSPEVYWARAYTRLFSEDVPGAIEDFRKAVELDPLDPVYRADLAWSLTDWWGPESKQIGGDAAAQDEAAILFGLAAELDPENDEFGELAQQFVEARSKK